MRTLAYSLCFTIAIVLMPGCGGKKESASKNSSNTSTNNTSNEGGNNAADSGDGNNSAPPAQDNRPVQRFDKKGRPLPSVAGPGGASGGAASAPRQNNNRPANNASNNEVASGNFTGEGTLTNGLFPQPGAGLYDKAFNMTGVGGGLFPQRGYTSVSVDSSSEDSGVGNNIVTDNGSSGAEAKTTGSGKGELFDMAADSFRSGDGTKAFHYVNAHMLTSDLAMEEYPMKWYPGIKQPRVALRWGVGVVVSVPSDLDGKFPVIGDEVEEEDSSSGNNRNRGAGSDTPAMGGGGGNNRGPSGGSDSDSPYAKVDTETANGLLLYYTGDFGERLIKRFESRRQSGNYYGMMLKEMPEVLPENPVATNNRASTPPLSGRNKRNFVMPSIGGPGGSGGKGSTGAGGGGGDNGGSGGSLVSRWATNSTASEPASGLVGELTPGVLCLGSGTREQIAARALKHDVDALLIFTVRVIKARKGKYQTITSLRLVDVNDPSVTLKNADGDPVQTKNLKHDVVGKYRNDGKDPDKDPVEVQLDTIFSGYADPALKGANMPELTEDVVQRRVGGLVDNSSNPLRDAFEVLWYHRQGLLGEAEAVSAIDSLTSNNGDVIVNGSVADKTDALKRFIKTGRAD